MVDGAAISIVAITASLGFCVLAYWEGKRDGERNGYIRGIADALECGRKDGEAHG